MRKLRHMFILTISVAVVLGGGWWGWQRVMHPGADLPAAICQDATQLDTSQVQVQVLNAGDVRGRANRVASILRQQGIIVTNIGNAELPPSAAPEPAGRAVTVIVGTNVDDPEVQLVAGFFPDAFLIADSREDHRVDVFVTNDSAMANPQAPQTISVPSGQICLPARPLTKSDNDS